MFLIGSNHMKLHYSQTLFRCFNNVKKFQYLMKLHYSQTTILVIIAEFLFQYLMKLHYSQTIPFVFARLE